MNIVIPQPQPWCGHWLWLNRLYSTDELVQRIYRIGDVWYEYVRN